MSHHEHRSGRLLTAVLLAIVVALATAGSAGAWRGHGHHHSQGQSLWGFYDNVLTKAKYVDVHTDEEPDDGPAVHVRE
jgi:hypothetical protein